MVAVFPLAGEERIMLQGVSWKFYESMLQELGEARVVRVAYDRGMLEIMSPLMPHGRGKCGIDLLIAALAEAFSSSAIDKLSLYAAMGVPEFWRYDGTKLNVYVLLADKYVQQETSPTFAPIPVAEIPQFLREAKEIGEIPMVKKFRAWVQEIIARG
jgi:hypothetical protein